MGKRIQNNKGFTIIELMIATAVFSVVLLLCATAIVQVGRMFYKGTVINRTQTATRNTIDDVSQAIQFNAGTARSDTRTIGSITVNSYCFGAIRYSYAPAAYSLGSGDGKLPHILWKDRVTGTGCTPVDVTSASLSGGQELMGDSMRLAEFAPTQSASIWTVKVTVAYGATNDLFTDNTYKTCVGSNLGGQFCAVSGITTNVIKRL